MPASPLIPNTVQVRLLWAIASNGAINVLHAIAPAGFAVNQTTANTLGSAIKGTAFPPFAGSLHVGTQLVRVGLRDMRVVGGTEFLDAGAAVTGTVAGDPLPPQTAGCITLRTALSGKSFRGRVYLGGAAEPDNIAGGLMSSTFQTAAVAFLTAVSSAMTASGLTFCVSTRAAEETIITATTNHTDGTTTVRTLSHERAKAAQSNAVTLIQSRNASWETQRRRNNGRGALPTIFNSQTESVLTHPT